MRFHPSARLAGALVLVALFCVARPSFAQQQDSVLAVTRAGETLLRVNVDGKVGIGTAAPTHRLTVAGGVKADSVAAALARVDSLHAALLRAQAVLATRVQADSVTTGLLRFGDGSGMTTARITRIKPTTSVLWNNITLHYYKDPFGMVHFSGRIYTTNAGSSGQVFVLPEGYRPAETQEFLVSKGNSLEPVKITVNTNGNVTSSFAYEVYLSGITFLAAQ